MRTLLPLQLPTIGGYHHHQMPIESGTVAELSEAECDTLKKLKLGMRSSLWSRPNIGNSVIGENNETNSNNPLCQPIEPTSNPSDYSIAVWIHFSISHSLSIYEYADVSVSANVSSTKTFVIKNNRYLYIYINTHMFTTPQNQYSEPNLDLKGKRLRHFHSHTWNHLKYTLEKHT